MESSFKGFYRGKRVLVTGDTGFKGSWLCVWLNELGASVTGYALEPPSDPSNFVISNLGSRIRHVHGDVRDFGSLLNVFTEFQPDLVFHMAAQALVRYSYEVPKETIDTNVLGTTNVLEAIRQTPSVRQVVIVTSDKCYENREQVWGYKENDPLGGDDPYSASKGAAEIVFRAYLKSFFHHRKNFGAVSVRAGNVIGGGDWAKDRIVSDSIRSLHQKQSVQVRNPLAIRPWQHVLEPLSGYLWLAARLSEEPESFSGSWNFGPADSSAKCVRDLVATIIREWGSGSWDDVSSTNDRKLHEAGWLRLTCDKAHMMLPWSAVLSFDENIRMTVKWYRYYYDYRDANLYQFCVHQIRDYAQLAAAREQIWAM